MRGGGSVHICVGSESGGGCGAGMDSKANVN